MIGDPQPVEIIRVTFLDLHPQPVEYSFKPQHYPWYRLWLENELNIPRDPRKLVQIAGIA
jgi:hypothetical protein